MIQAQSWRRGFTLIEIVVVLALAAMILAGVLLAVGAANQSARDSQRRNAITQVEAALEQWALTHSNSYANNGALLKITDLYGGATCGASTQYLDCGVTAPGTSGEFAAGATTGPTATNQISIADRSGGTTTNNGYCVTVKLEGGGGEVYGSTDTNKAGRNMTGAKYCQ